MYIFFILNILSYLKGPTNITDIMDHVQGNVSVRNITKQYITQLH